jgi:hypothetical protein
MTTPSTFPIIKQPETILRRLRLQESDFSLLHPIAPAFV